MSKTRFLAPSIGIRGILRPHMGYSKKAIRSFRSSNDLIKEVSESADTVTFYKAIKPSFTYKQLAEQQHIRSTKKKYSSKYEQRSPIRTKKQQKYIYEISIKNIHTIQTNRQHTARLTPKLQNRNSFRQKTKQNPNFDTITNLYSCIF